MDPAQKQYLFLYALIVIPIAVSFFFIRRGVGPPVKLQLRSGEATPPQTQPLLDEAQAGKHESPSLASHGAPQSSQAPQETALNVFFNWNGHSWDAYEVLGIPAGSSREAATAAYQKARLECDAESLLFFQAAYDAIVKSASARG